MRTSKDIFKNMADKAFGGDKPTYPSDDSGQRIMDNIMLKKEFQEDDKIENTEATGAASAGGFSAPLFGDMKEEELEGGLADKMGIEDIARKHGIDVDEMFEQLRKGIKVEMEHTKELEVAYEIALDHLFENPKYYDDLEEIEPQKFEAKEATGSASAGSYETPFFLAKNLKNWRGGKKPIYKGGKFVSIKEKCKKFPYCNQGDIKALNLFTNANVKEAISRISESRDIPENVIKSIIVYEMEKLNGKTK